MAITQYYSPSALSVGQAAFQIGLGEALRADEERALREAQFFEGQRQFDATQGLREQQLAGGLVDDEFRRRLAGEQLRLQRFRLGQQGAQAAAQQQARLQQADLMGQYGLAENQQRLQAEALQQQAMGQRQQNQIGAQFQMQRNAALARQMEADWENVQRALPKLDPDERADLIGQFENRYADTGLPMPVELPEQALPEWMDPEVKLNQMRSMYPNAPWQVDPESGEVGLPRGWNYQMDPQYIQGQRDHEKEMETVRSEAKREDVRYKADLKAQETEVKLQQEQAKAEQQRQHQEALARIRESSELMTAKIKARQLIMDMRQKLAEAKAQAAAAKATADGEGPAIDYSAQQSEIETAIEQMEADLASLDSVGASGEPPTPVSTREEIAALKPGQRFILPDGRTGTRQ